MDSIDPAPNEVISALRTPAPSIPVRGYITKEDGEHLWLRDERGIWLIDKNDIVTTREWQGTADPRFTGKPILLFIREGADIYELRHFKVQLLTPPITLKQLAHGTPVRVKGKEVIESSGDDAASREIGFRPNSGISPRMSGGWITVCCWDSDWGTTFQADDCEEWPWGAI